MKTIKIVFSVSMLLSATVMPAQTTDDVLIDSVENSLSGNVCRTIVIDNQPERRSKTYLRVKGVDESPIVIYLDPDHQSKRQYTAAKKSERTKKSMRPGRKVVNTTPVEKEEKSAETSTEPTDTVIQEAPVMAQNATEGNDNSKYYYGIGGILGGVLLMSPLYFRNRKKK